MVTTSLCISFPRRRFLTRHAILSNERTGKERVMKPLERPRGRIMVYSFKWRLFNVVSRGIICKMEYITKWNLEFS